jgi:hypothetical protein
MRRPKKMTIRPCRMEFYLSSDLMPMVRELADKFGHRLVATAANPAAAQTGMVIEFLDRAAAERFREAVDLVNPRRTVLIYRTVQDLEVFQSALGNRPPDFEIPIDGEPALGAAIYRDLTQEELDRIDTIYATQFAAQTDEETAKATLLMALMKFHDTGRFSSITPWGPND